MLGAIRKLSSSLLPCGDMIVDDVTATALSIEFDLLLWLTTWLVVWLQWRSTPQFAELLKLVLRVLVRGSGFRLGDVVEAGSDVEQLELLLFPVAVGALFFRHKNLGKSVRHIQLRRNFLMTLWTSLVRKQYKNAIRAPWKRKQEKN